MSFDFLFLLDTVPYPFHPGATQCCVYASDDSFPLWLDIICRPLLSGLGACHPVCDSADSNSDILRYPNGVVHAQHYGADLFVHSARGSGVFADAGGDRYE